MCKHWIKFQLPAEESVQYKTGWVNMRIKISRLKSAPPGLVSFFLTACDWSDVYDAFRSSWCDNPFIKVHMRVNNLLGPAVTRDGGNCWHTHCVIYDPEKCSDRVSCLLTITLKMIIKLRPINMLRCLLRIGSATVGLLGVAGSILTGDIVVFLLWVLCVVR